MISVTAGCLICGTRFTRHVLTAQDAALVALGGQCDPCYDRQELARERVGDDRHGDNDEGGEA